MRRSAAPSKLCQLLVKVPKSSEIINDFNIPCSCLIPDKFLNELFQYQINGVQFMYNALINPGHQTGVILADQMGLGKTAQVICLIASIKSVKLETKVTILCPANLVKNWLNEFRKWLPEDMFVGRMCCTVHSQSHYLQFMSMRFHPVLIMSYELALSGLKRNWFDCERQIDICVCDEAHRICNSDNLTFNMVSRINATAKIMVTGTPVQNTYKEFANLVSLCAPNLLPSSFKRIYAARQNAEYSLLDDDDIADILKPILLRRTAVAASLPKRTDILLVCKPTMEQTKTIENIVDSHFCVSEFTNNFALKIISDIRKACDGTLEATLGLGSRYVFLNQ
ncbi:hypothetical protein GJ496_001538 [Pomphorhynchus laevis]|nr:hypothetical protein GJ496_001538 [Pomphorhynchus laevis]